MKLKHKKRSAGSAALISLNHMAEGWCGQLASALRAVCHDLRPPLYTVGSVATELWKWGGKVTLNLLCLLCPTRRCFPYGAGCRSVRHTARSAPSPATVFAPFAWQNGSGEGEIGHQYNYGRRWVQQIDRAHFVEEGERVFSGAGTRSKRYQLALEGKVGALCGMTI